MAVCAGARLALLVAALSLPHAHALRDSFDADQSLSAEEGVAGAGADLSSHAEEEIDQAGAYKFTLWESVWAKTTDKHKNSAVEEWHLGRVTKIVEGAPRMVTVEFHSRSIRSGSARLEPRTLREDDKANLMSYDDPSNEARDLRVRADDSKTTPRSVFAKEAHKYGVGGAVYAMPADKPPHTELQMGRVVKVENQKKGPRRVTVKFDSSRLKERTFEEFDTVNLKPKAGRYPYHPSSSKVGASPTEQRERKAREQELLKKAQQEDYTMGISDAAKPYGKGSRSWVK